MTDTSIHKEIRLQDPVMDLTLAVAVLSSLYNVPLPERSTVWREANRIWMLRSSSISTTIWLTKELFCLFLLVANIAFSFFYCLFLRKCMLSRTILVLVLFLVLFYIIIQYTHSTWVYNRDEKYFF